MAHPELLDSEDAADIDDILNPKTELQYHNATAIESMERAAIDVQIATAKKYPRNVTMVRKRMEAMATMDEDTAASMCYALPRGGKPIEGPSVKLAEVVATQWGNCRIIVDPPVDEGEFISGTASFHDLESNTAIRMAGRRRITGKDGKRFNDDMIGVTGQALSSILFRNIVFRGVPSAFIQPIYKKARDIMKGNASTLAETRAKAVEHLAKLGVFADRLCAALGIAAIEQIDAEHIVTLRGTLTAIKEGTVTVDAAFPPVATASGKPTVEQQAKDAAKPRAPRKSKPEDPHPVTPATQPEAQPTKPSEPQQPVVSGPLSDLLDMMADDSISEQTATTHLRRIKRLGENQTMSDLSEADVNAIINDYDRFKEAMS